MSVTEYDDTDEEVISSGWMTAIAIVMIVLGLIAIAFPFFTAIASTVLFGWIFIFAGIAQIAYAFQSRDAGKIVWKMILGFLYLLSGIFVMVNPLEGAVVLQLNCCEFRCRIKYFPANCVSLISTLVSLGKTP